MVINIKHFVITITAIFLSLGIGIFIGVIIDSQHLFIEQQRVLVTQIEEEFDGFKQKNYELMKKLNDYKIENDRNDRFLDLIYSKLTKEALEVSNIMVINMFVENNYLDINNVLSDMGVKSTAEIKVPLECAEKAGDLDFDIGDADRDETYKNHSEKVIARLSVNGYSLLPFYLKQVNFLEFKGNIYSSIDYVIIIDDGYKMNNKYCRALRRDLVNLIKANNIPIVAIESSKAAHSSVPFYKEQDISTVDNGDTMLGKIAMLMILKGRKGHFGEKETAEYLLPEDFLVFQ